MAVYKDDKTGKWFFRVYITDPITGNRIQRERKGFVLRRDALAAEAQFTNDSQNREIVIANIDFDEVIDEYLIFQKKRLKNTTYVGINYQIEKHIRPYFSNVKTRNITRVLLENWYNNLDKNDYTYTYKNKILTQLKAIFNYLDDQYNFRVRFLNTFPPFSRKASETRNEVVTYDLEQFNEFLSYTENILEETLFMTLFYSGIRIGELRGLTWKDVDFKNRVLNIDKQATSKIPGKGTVIITPKSESSNRKVFVPVNLVNKLQEWKTTRVRNKTFNESWNVFGDETFISENRIRRMVKRITDESGLPYIKLHEFRHSYSTLMYSLNIDPKIVQAQAGHSTVQITLDTYTHIGDKDKKNAVDEMFNNGSKNNP